MKRRQQDLLLFHESLQTKTLGSFDLKVVNHLVLNFVHQRCHPMALVTRVFYGSHGSDNIHSLNFWGVKVLGIFPNPCSKLTIILPIIKSWPKVFNRALINRRLLDTNMHCTRLIPLPSVAAVAFGTSTNVFVGTGTQDPMGTIDWLSNGPNLKLNWLIDLCIEALACLNQSLLEEWGKRLSLIQAAKYGRLACKPHHLLLFGIGLFCLER